MKSSTILFMFCNNSRSLGGGAFGWGGGAFGSVVVGSCSSDMSVRFQRSVRQGHVSLRHRRFKQPDQTTTKENQKLSAVGRTGTCIPQTPSLQTTGLTTTITRTKITMALLLLRSKRTGQGAGVQRKVLLARHHLIH
jgi:hypothetical protein